MEITNLINQSRDEVNYILDNLNNEDIIYLVNVIKNKEIIYFSGVGKSESIAIHICRILKSIGFKCFDLNILNSLHGDIGTITENDALILFSKSGNTDEIISKIENFKLKKCLIIGISNNSNNKFDKYCDKSIKIPFNQELELYNNKIPTNSSISILLFFNVIISLLANNISINEYSINHSSGSIGNSLKKIKDVLITKFPKFNIKDKLKFNSVCLEMTKYVIGSSFFINDNEELVGMLTDGDLRRLLITNQNLEFINENEINKDYYFEEDVEKYVKDIDLDKKYIPVLKGKKLIGIINCVKLLSN